MHAYIARFEAKMIHYTGSFNPALAAPPQTSSCGSSPSTSEHCCMYEATFRLQVTMQFLLALFTLVVASLISWTVYTRFFHPYSSIPGPFLASLSRLWLVQCVRGGKVHEVTLKLHERYAPDEVSVSDPQAVDLIYGVKSSFRKTDFYDPFAPKNSSNGDLFTMRDEKLHTERRKMVNSMYNMSSVLELEKYVDVCTGIFTQRLAQIADSGEAIDLGKWLWMYTFDVIGELFFGRHFGFMEKSHDYEGWMEMLENLFPVNVLNGVMPSFLRNATLLVSLFDPAIRKGIAGMGTLKKAAGDCVSEKQFSLQRGEAVRHDMLSKALDIYEADLDNERKMPQHKMLWEDLQTEAIVAIGAGSETTAIALRAIIHQIVTNPNVHDKLLSEIDNAEQEGRFNRPYARYAEVIRLPYLIACCKEGMRMHPRWTCLALICLARNGNADFGIINSVAMTLPREIPKGGLKIGNTYLPAGYKVGVNPAVIHFDREIFGIDVDTFRPWKEMQRRWIAT
ncbi:cytochrome P450 monooxygenase [Physcia stellaris]|nr:cytochrome P450 monooxygenase [Physcia stellaris]